MGVYMLLLLSRVFFKLIVLSVLLSVLFLVSRSDLNAAPFTDRSKVGDLWLAGSALYAYGMTLGLSDVQGAVELTEVTVLTQLISETLKVTVKERRPNKANRHSFPSGHAAGAFSAATFVHKRYGFTPAVLPYLMATAVGWSRVDQRAHYTHDVLAGAAIAGLCSYFFVSKNENVTFTYNFDEVKFGLSFNI